MFGEYVYNFNVTLQNCITDNVSKHSYKLGVKVNDARDLRAHLQQVVFHMAEIASEQRVYYKSSSGIRHANLQKNYEKKDVTLCQRLRPM